MTTASRGQIIRRTHRPGNMRRRSTWDRIRTVSTPWVAVIRDNATGAEVFRDSYAYDNRHGVGITWLSSADQLWLLSNDVGTAHVDRKPDGTWIKPSIYPETVGDIPEEIKAVGG